MLRNFKIWQKLSLIVVAFTIPMGVLLHFLVSEQNIILDFAHNELDGTQYLRPVRKLLADSCEHRMLAAAALVSGDPAARDRMLAKETEVSADLRVIEEVDQRFAAKFKSSKSLGAVKTFWNDLVKRIATFTPEVSYEQHRKLANLITDLIIVVGNDSYLILDPDVDSYYAMDATIFKIPGLVNQVSQLDALATVALATHAGSDSALARRAQLASGHAVAEEALVALRSNLAYGLAANKDMDERLRPLVGYVDNAMRDYLEAIEHVNAASATMSARELSAMAARATSASFTLWDAALPMLDSLLGTRIEHNSHRRLLSFFGVTLAVMLSILLTILIVRSITHPLQRLAEAAEKISMGDMAVELDVHGSDEIGELSERFRRMQESLKVAMQQLGG